MNGIMDISWPTLIFFFVLKKIPQSNYFYVQSSIAVIFIDLIKNQDIIFSFELSECVSVPVCVGVQLKFDFSWFCLLLEFSLKMASR